MEHMCPRGQVLKSSSMDEVCGASEDCTAKCCQAMSVSGRAVMEKNKGLCPIDLMVVADRSGSIVCSQEKPDSCAADVRKTVKAVFDAVTSNLDNPDNKLKNRMGLITFSTDAQLQLDMNVHSSQTYHQRVDREIACPHVSSRSCTLSGKTNHGAALREAFEAMQKLPVEANRTRVSCGRGGLCGSASNSPLRAAHCPHH